MSRKTDSAAALETLLADLNPQQRAAAQHGDEPLLIVAGAGTGKTTTLAHRVASLIARGVEPGRILLLTFTPPLGRRDVAAGRCPAGSLAQGGPESIVRFERGSGAFPCRLGAARFTRSPRACCGSTVR